MLLRIHQIFMCINAQFLSTLYICNVFAPQRIVFFVQFNFTADKNIHIFYWVFFWRNWKKVFTQVPIFSYQSWQSLDARPLRMKNVRCQFFHLISMKRVWLVANDLPQPTAAPERYNFIKIKCHVHCQIYIFDRGDVAAKYTLCEVRGRISLVSVNWWSFLEIHWAYIQSIFHLLSSLSIMLNVMAGLLYLYITYICYADFGSICG